MTPDFIFMLTRSDQTVPDAMERLGDVVAAGAGHIGFKDVGLPVPELRRLADAIRRAGATVYLEVVSLDEESEARSARAAVELGVDVMMGGTRPSVVLPIIKGSGIRYMPFAGKVVGHPSVLTGTVDQIAESARELTAIDGVDGIDLLAYRFAGDVPNLMRRVVAAVTPKPVVMAGSINRDERIDAVLRSGAAGFTVGTAALDAVFPAGSSRLFDQTRHILAALQQPLA